METANTAITPPSKGVISGGAIALFVLACIGISGLILVAQTIVWNLEQTAIADGSFAFLDNAGKIWFPIQALVIAALAGLGVGISKSVFRPVYRSWMIAALVTLPAWVLQFLGPNDDQLGAVMQIVIAAVAGLAVLLIWRRMWRWDGRVLLAVFIVPFGIWPFLLWGALGSGTDVILNLLAGLAFGLLAASLVVTTDGNYLLNGLGIGVLLAILGSALGYDGAQLLLLIVLPACSHSAFTTAWHFS